MKFIRSLAVFSVSVAALVFQTAGTSADISDAAKCGDRAELAEILKDKFDQHPVGVGLSHSSSEAFEVYASKDGSWTVMMTQTNGKTCIMAGGHSWKALKLPVPGIPT